MPERNWTEKQGQYLAFITNYSVIHGQPPAEADMQCFFGVTPPSVHQMVLKLEELGFISRVPGKARTIRVLVAPEDLPILRDRRQTMAKKTTSRAPIYQIKVTLDGSKPPICKKASPMEPANNRRSAAGGFRHRKRACGYADSFPSLLYLWEGCCSPLLTGCTTVGRHDTWALLPEPPD